MKIKTYNLNNKKVQYLINSDKKLGNLIKIIKSCNILIEENGFKCIIKYIIGQQISDKTRERIWQQLCKNYKNISPKTINDINEKELKNIGLSKQKISYIKNLSSAVLNNQIDFENLKNLTNEEIINILTKIKGIGNWTAEMYLIFSLGRENVLSKRDFSIKRVIKWMYNLNDMPNNKELDMYFANWAEYSTIVSAYFWEAISRNVLSKKFDEIK